jgi:putative hydrolase of the HAD superfamily
MTIILDLGGVLMQHNMPECMARFRAMLGEEAMAEVLGMKSNAEGLPNSLMDQYECGAVSTDEFVGAILSRAKTGTTAQDVQDAWNAMHAGIPAERLELIRSWQQAGHRLVMLSNNNALHWDDIHQNYDLSMFDRLFSSHLEHCNKPNRGIYEVVHSYLTDNDYEMPYYFVDDLQANRQMGETFGWITYPTLDALNQVINPL